MMMTTDEQYWELAGIVARRLGFQIEAVEKVLRRLNDNPITAYSEIVEKSEPWSFVWTMMGGE